MTKIIPCKTSAVLQDSCPEGMYYLYYLCLTIPGYELIINLYLVCAPEGVYVLPLCP